MMDDRVLNFEIKWLSQGFLRCWVNVEIYFGKSQLFKEEIRQACQSQWGINLYSSVPTQGTLLK